MHPLHIRLHPRRQLCRFNIRRQCLIPEDSLFSNLWRGPHINLRRSLFINRNIKPSLNIRRSNLFKGNRKCRLKLTDRYKHRGKCHLDNKCRLNMRGRNPNYSSRRCRGSSKIRIICRNTLMLRRDMCRDKCRLSQLGKRLVS